MTTEKAMFFEQFDFTKILLPTMGESQSAAVDGTEEEAEQASVTSREAIAHRRTNIRMVQNVLLVWLDGNIDDDSADCQNTISQLRRVMNAVDTFTDGDECIEFISSMYDDRACMIISGYLGQHIVPHVHDMPQVDPIFILCGNKKRHEQWAKNWPKIKGVFTEIPSICNALKQAAQQCEQNSIAISFMPTTGDMANKNMDQLDCSFMYAQILKEVLLSIKFEQSHIQEFIAYCRDVFADNDEELVRVKELEEKYHQNTPIWWYTCEGFLYPMLNRALRLMDVNIIIKLGFFIADLHRHIEQLYMEQFNSHESSATFTVYRGQGMSKTDFEQMTNIKGGLMSFNNFLSTSKDRNVSVRFASNALTNPDLVGILFVMTIEPSVSTTPFASVTDVSYFQGEDEILFSMHTIFRIRDIKSMSENNRLFQVDLTLTSESDKDFLVLTDFIREETEGSTGWDQLGRLLLKMGEFNKAEQVYNVMLEQTSDEEEQASIYSQLAAVKDDQGEYEEAIAFYEKSIEIKEKHLPPKHPSLAASYNNLGEAYRKMGVYWEALLYYEESLAIHQQSLPPNHPDFAISYNNIGIVYYRMGEFTEALSSYEKALAIKQLSLPPNHPDLASSYNNIGAVYYSMEEYSEALSYYEKALTIKQQSLPPNHPALGESYNNIGLVYKNMEDYSKARSFLERAVDIGQHSLPPNHPELQGWQMNLDRLNEIL